MTARQVCLGWHWYPYAYSRTVTDGDGTPVKPFPAWLDELGRRAVTDALGAPTASYDIALINFYDGDARMGMHRDSDEK
jgi:alkylated DNA repair protein (DNA oxidative demethylase)